MKTLVILNIFLLNSIIVCAASWDQGKEWLEATREYKDEILDKLKDSKQFTQNQLGVIEDCLDEPETKEVLNCFSGGGVEKAAGALTLIGDELSRIRERICSGDSWGDRNKCQKFGDSLEKMKKDLQASWSELVNRGKSYLEQSNKLFFMKRKICKKINQEGCYQWLNERIDLKCRPQKAGNDAVNTEDCQLEVTQEVWERVSSQ
jgi:hypothetical protein